MVLLKICNKRRKERQATKIGLLLPDPVQVGFDLSGFWSQSHHVSSTISCRGYAALVTLDIDDGNTRLWVHATLDTL